MNIAFETERLILRQWRDEDLEPFAALNADAEVMHYFPAPLSRDASDVMATRCRTLIAERGWGFWALERKDTGEFIGFTGLNKPGYPLPFSPCVEIGWRLARPHWGQGFATEAARTALRLGFEELELAEIVSFASFDNLRSRNVMERVGMKNTNETFMHPAMPESHPLSLHCLYRLSYENWLVTSRP